jgi:hypothetical protein
MSRMTGVSLTIPQNARNDFALARAYLSRDVSMRATFRNVDRSRRTFHLRINHRGDDHFDPQTNTIAWDPYSALRTTQRGRQSPALGLGHEMAHAAEPAGKEAALERRALPRYDNCEERRVIRGCERHAARTLGEAVRCDHRGTLYRVATPVSR